MINKIGMREREHEEKKQQRQNKMRTGQKVIV